MKPGENNGSTIAECNSFGNNDGVMSSCVSMLMLISEATPCRWNRSMVAQLNPHFYFSRLSCTMDVSPFFIVVNISVLNY